MPIDDLLFFFFIFSSSDPAHFWVTMSSAVTDVTALVLLVLITSRIAYSQLGAATEGSVHDCYRRCDDESTSRKICRYEFVVTSLSNVNSTCDASSREGSTCRDKIQARSFMAVNGVSPGPAIEICLGDTIDVFVYNKLGTDELSFHWHGIRQKDLAHMDGVPMVTQCPILSYGAFRYKIIPESAGTYLYHAHSVSQQGDGVYGSLTVRGPSDDPILERMLLLSSRPTAPLTKDLHLHPPTPSELLVNGQAHDDEAAAVALPVSRGRKYLLRLVNGNAYNCPISFSISGHSFHVSSADGNPVQAVAGSHAILFPGERLDVILETNKNPGKYLIAVQGLQDCRHLYREMFLVYDEAETDSPVTKESNIYLKEDHIAIAEQGYDCHRISNNTICTLDLDATESFTSKNDESEETIYISYDARVINNFTDDMTDHKYDLYKNIFYPAYLSLGQEEKRIPQISNMSFKYPSSPILSQPENTPEEIICSFEKHSKKCNDTPLFCECVQIFEVPARKIIEIVLIDEGFGGNTTYTFHVHGYNVSILGRKSLDRPVSKEEIISFDRNGELPRNFVNPLKKDTFAVPNKGYIILRIFTDNLGYWLWEARSTGIYPGILGPGMQFLMRVGTRRSMPIVPINFPSCGNNKGLDLIFETS